MALTVDQLKWLARLLRARRRAWTVFASALAGLVGLALIAAAVVPLPYVLISPGRAMSVDDVVTIDGAETYEHDGSLLFVTVGVSDSRPNAYTVLDGWLDDAVTVKPEDDVLRGRSREEEEQLNVLLMTDSQLAAKKVALERLGYEVPAESFGIAAIEGGSPADGQLEVGDRITAVDGIPAPEVEDFGAAVRARSAGTAVTFIVERDDETLTLTVPTRAASEGPYAGQAQIGVQALPQFSQSSFPIDVEIDTEEVGGPSAGLAFTLTILDELTPGDLTGGEEVAVTGTIELDGSVGPIGGMEQKAITARRAGAELFLVPEAEAGEARRHAGDLEVVGVADLDDALAALEAAGGDPLPPPV